MNASDVTTELDNKIAALKATAGIMQLRGPDRGGRPRQVAIAGTSNAFVNVRDWHLAGSRSQDGSQSYGVVWGPLSQRS
jgi:hypothetical protein